MTAAILAGILLTQPLPPPEPLPPELHDLVVTFYDPSLGGINCSADCTKFGNGQTVQRHHYGRVAACPVSWRGRTVVIDGGSGELGSWTCVDSGGAVVMHWTKEDGLHAHLDILSHEPVMARGPWEGWHFR